MRKNSVKMIRINREFQRELSTLISMEVKDPRISPMTSVVSVDVAPDLKTSKVYVSVLGDAQAQKDTLAGLRSAASFLRSQLAHNLNLRNTPELTFVMDQSIEYGVNMSHMIEDVIEHDEANYVPDPFAEDDTEEEEEEDEGYEEL
jgi:ribosome-binding factor A